MRLVFLHTASIEFEARQQASEHAETDGVSMTGQMDECLTVLVTVEPVDQTDTDTVVARTLAEIETITEQLNTDAVVVYPTMHLSEAAAGLDSTRAVLDTLDTELRNDAYELLRAPAGWNRRLDISVKGHPFSVQSRTIAPQEEDSAEDAASDFRVLSPDGSIKTLDDETRDDETLDDTLRSLFDAERSTNSPAHSLTGHSLEPLVEHGFAHSVSSTDMYPQSLLPRGKFLFDTLVAYADELLSAAGGRAVQTPLTCDLDSTAIAAHAGEGPREEFRLATDEHATMVRPATCLGLLSLAAAADLTSTQLPVSLYETPGRSIRSGRSHDGETSQPVECTIPEMQTITADRTQARTVIRKQLQQINETRAALDLDCRLLVRATRTGYENNQSFLAELAAECDESLLLEIREQSPAYWSLSIESIAVDRAGNLSPLSTLQLDLNSAERFGISVTEHGETQYPPIIHYRPLGCLESTMAALLASERSGCPTWLAPTQVRLIPIEPADHHARCVALADELSPVRVDIDDRELSVGERLEAAEDDWVPYTAVIGDDELTTEILGVTVHTEPQERELTASQLRETVLDDVAQRPQKRNSIPRSLSGRLSFSG